MNSGPKRSRGFSLVSAIFVLVVLAMIGAFMVTIGALERWTVASAVQGARAYQAAQAGIEWGVFQALNNRAATCGAAPATPVTSNFNLTASGIGGFAITVVCSYTDQQDSGITGTSIPVTANVFKVFLISSTAASGTFGSNDFFSRTIQVTATDAP